jgi:hypothetical protein
MLLTDSAPLLQLDDVSKARPEITKTVENMVSQGKWTVPGYTESASTLSLPSLCLLKLTLFFPQSSACVSPVLFPLSLLSALLTPSSSAEPFRYLNGRYRVEKGVCFVCKKSLFRKRTPRCRRRRPLKSSFFHCC